MILQKHLFKSTKPYRSKFFIGKWFLYVIHFEKKIISLQITISKYFFFKRDVFCTILKVQSFCISLSKYFSFEIHLSFKSLRFQSICYFQIPENCDICNKIGYNTNFFAALSPSGHWTIFCRTSWTTKKIQLSPWCLTEF